MFTSYKLGNGEFIWVGEEQEQCMEQDQPFPQTL